MHPHPLLHFFFLCLLYLMLQTIKSPPISLTGYREDLRIHFLILLNSSLKLALHFQSHKYSNSCLHALHTVLSSICYPDQKKFGKYFHDWQSSPKWTDKNKLRNKSRACQGLEGLLFHFPPEYTKFIVLLTWNFSCKFLHDSLPCIWFQKKLRAIKRQSSC